MGGGIKQPQRRALGHFHFYGQGQLSSSAQMFLGAVYARPPIQGAGAQRGVIDNKQIFPRATYTRPAHQAQGAQRGGYQLQAARAPRCQATAFCGRISSQGGHAATQGEMWGSSLRVFVFSFPSLDFF